MFFEAPKFVKQDQYTGFYTPVFCTLYVYLGVKQLPMTVKLNLTIDEEVVKRTKRYAKRTNTSISKMVQEYLDKTTKNEKTDKKSFVEKYAGSLNGHLSDLEIERLKAQRAKEKYGY